MTSTTRGKKEHARPGKKKRGEEVEGKEGREGGRHTRKEDRRRERQGEGGRRATDKKKKKVGSAEGENRTRDLQIADCTIMRLAQLPTVLLPHSHYNAFFLMLASCSIASLLLHSFPLCASLLLALLLVSRNTSHLVVVGLRPSSMMEMTVREGATIRRSRGRNTRNKEGRGSAACWLAAASLRPSFLPSPSQPSFTHSRNPNLLAWAMCRCAFARSESLV